MVRAAALAVALASLSPRLRPGNFVFAPVEVARRIPFEVTLLTNGKKAHVIRQADADAHHIPYETVVAWIILDIDFSGSSKGLSDYVRASLGRHGIVCHVVKGPDHKNVLVPAGQASQAMRELQTIALQQRLRLREGR
jgi:hypothetical protein